MSTEHRIAELHDELIEIRHDIHRHPEIAFEEVRTADIVAEKLEGWGLDVDRGLGKTGVVGTLRAGDSNRAIGLRADMDALPVDELNSFEHRSVIDGKMHACGHDGHTTMLLGAARYLAESRSFNGTIHFIFQPAEEMLGGAKVMVADGLFEKFPVESVWGMHNMPGLPAGQFSVASGPVMAAADEYRVKITGVGGHAAYPHYAVDPVYIASEIIVALQTIASRRVDPLGSVVVSTTVLRAGNAGNVIPESAEMVGSARAFTIETQDEIESSIRRIAEGVAQAHGATAEVGYTRGYPPTINHSAETEIARRAAIRTVGAENVGAGGLPMMASEDFSFMLNERPGCYLFIGNGEGDHAVECHNPNYDFNDAILPIGVRYWVNLVEDIFGAA
jgi:hippurate hydrolase